MQLSSLMMLSSSLTVSALIATPASAPFCSSQSSASAVQMSLSRRAVAAGALAAAVPMAAFADTGALATLKSDLSKLEADEEVVKALDQVLNKERKLAFEDEVLLQKKTDAFLKALQKDDAAGVAAIKLEIKEIQARYDAEEKKVLALTAEETKAVDVENKLAAKVKVDMSAELAEEDKALIKAEIAEAEDDEGINIVNKFFGGLFGSS